MYSSYQGTARIGLPLIQETEFSQGETISLIVQVAGTTGGKTYLSNFQHENFGNLAPEAIGQGSFTVLVLDGSTIQLTSHSLGLATGRYIYDILATDLSGNSSVSSLKEFKVAQSVTNSLSSGGSVAPTVNSTQQLIDSRIAEHNANLSAHPSLSGGSGGGGGGAQFDLTFTQATLTSGDLLPVQHTLPSAPSAVSVYDSYGAAVALGHRVLSSTTFEIDLADFVPLSGTWSLSATN
jgi:hypothetical protein